ncbi:MAG TPA: ABC transporter permease [Solirubrobacteraceae bacterium]|nr:ABC transporter permease [Solirubrobacteraceae bacterium]
MAATFVAYRWELRKLAAQNRTYLGIAIAAVGPIVYLLLAMAQGYPHAPLADNFGHTGVAFSLVVFKLIVVIGPAIIASLVAGDIVAAEDLGGTLKTILIRSVRRRQLLTAKALALYTYLTTAMIVFFVVATVVGVIAWGFHPVINISEHQISALHALGLGIASVAIYLLPVFALASFGLFLSVATRQSVAAIGGTLLYAMSLQGLAAISALRAVHPYLLTNQLTAWDDLFQTPVAADAILRSLWVSAAFALPPLLAAWAIFMKRDVTT